MVRVPRGMKSFPASNVPIVMLIACADIGVLPVLPLPLPVNAALTFSGSFSFSAKTFMVMMRLQVPASIAPGCDCQSRLLCERWKCGKTSYSSPSRRSIGTDNAQLDRVVYRWLVLQPLQVALRSGFLFKYNGAFCVLQVRNVRCILLSSAWLSAVFLGVLPL